MKSISKKLSCIAPSVTLAVTAKAKQLKKEGKDVVSFGAGEPDFDTPESIKNAAIHAILEGETKYTAESGTPELKQAVIEKVKHDLGLIYNLSQVSINCGAKHSIYNVLKALCNPGDEVIVAAPYWVSYPEQILLADSIPVFIETTDVAGFKMTPEQLIKAITPKTKAVILNSPSNPTGSLYTKEELRILADIIVKADVYVISDEIYDKLVYEGAIFTSIATLGDEIRQRTLVINGVSKTYAMTGWRIGYVLGDAAVIKCVNSYQGHTTSNPTSISQKAAEEALGGDQSVVETMRCAFEQRRIRMLKLLGDIPGVTCFPSEGAFYLFPNISIHYGKKHQGKVIANSVDFSNALLEHSLVAVVPGAGFGADNYIRLSYATSMENIEKGLARIKLFIADLL